MWRNQGADELESRMVDHSKWLCAPPVRRVSIAMSAVGNLNEGTSSLRETYRQGFSNANRQASGQPSGNPGMPNQALEQTRDSVLRYGESVGCELLNFFVLP